MHLASWMSNSNVRVVAKEPQSILEHSTHSILEVNLVSWFIYSLCSFFESGERQETRAERKEVTWSKWWTSQELNSWPAACYSLTYSPPALPTRLCSGPSWLIHDQETINKRFCAFLKTFRHQGSRSWESNRQALVSCSGQMKRICRL